MSDASGMRFYHTPKLREMDAGMMQFGTTALEIPAGAREVTQGGGCGSQCTKQFSSDVYVSMIVPHMHYYGEYSW